MLSAARYPIVLYGPLQLPPIAPQSPMLFAVGMYLPFPTTFAIFVGGIAKWFMETLRNRGNFNDAQRARMENIGVLCASGMIAGEALIGLVIAALRFFDKPVPVIFASPSFVVGLVVLGLILFILIRTPLANPGDPNEPAPPTAMM